MSATLSQDDFAALVRRAGLALSLAEITELHGAWGSVEPMLERIRGGMRPREAEPALIFRPEGA